MGNEPGTESHQMPQAQTAPTRANTDNQSRSSVPAQVPPENLNPAQMGKAVYKPQAKKQQNHQNHMNGHGQAAYSTANNGSQSQAQSSPSHAQRSRPSQPSQHAYNNSHSHAHAHAYQQAHQHAYQQYTHHHQNHHAQQYHHQHQYYHRPPPSSSTISPKSSKGTTGNASNNMENNNTSNKPTGNSNSATSSNGGVSVEKTKGQNQSQSQKQQQRFQFSQKLSISDFELLKLVGKGSFGQVWQVSMKKNQEIYALKILKKKDLVARKQVDHTNTERRILANIDHPFLVSLRYAFQTKTKLFMVMDFFNGGELFFHLQKVGKFQENRAKFYAAEICLAIECLHAHSITYRDLKPENILLDHDGHIKITDFGLSKDHFASNDDGILRTFCGSPEYLAPEMLLQNGYNHMVDWWSFGTILYEMICGLPPFYDTNIQQMYQNILYKPVPFYKFMSPNVIDVISRLLDKSPVRRIQCAHIKLHAFFAEIDWDKLYRKELPPPFKPNVRGKEDASNFEQVESSVDRKRQYLNQTPSIRTHSLIAAEGKFPNFTYDETTAENMICID